MLLENRFMLCSNDLCLIPFVTVWKLNRSHAVTPCWLDCKECILSGWSKQHDCCSSAWNPSRGCWLFRKLHFSKIIWQRFLMDLRLNAMRRHINLSVYLVFDLEAGRFKFLGENLLGVGAVEKLWAFHPWLLLITWSNSQPARPTRSLILSRKSFVTSKQFKWKA